MSETYLALSFHAFGWGDTPAEAQGNCRANISSADLKKHGMVTYRTHEKAVLSLVDGSVSSPVGHPPVKVADTRPVKWEKVEGRSYRATLLAREVLLVYQPEPMQMWQVIERSKLIGGVGNVDLKQAKAYVEKLLKGI